MNITEAHHTFIENLGAVYDPGEARSIARIVFEDALRIYDVQSKAPLFDIQQNLIHDIQERLLLHRRTRLLDIGNHSKRNQTIQVKNIGYRYR